jgi:hypothetical protein
VLDSLHRHLRLTPLHTPRVHTGVHATWNRHFLAAVGLSSLRLPMHVAGWPRPIFDRSQAQPRNSMSLVVLRPSFSACTIAGSAATAVPVRLRHRPIAAARGGCFTSHARPSCCHPRVRLGPLMPPRVAPPSPSATAPNSTRPYPLLCCKVRRRTRKLNRSFSRVPNVKP